MAKGKKVKKYIIIHADGHTTRVKSAKAVNRVIDQIVCEEDVVDYVIAPTQRVLYTFELWIRIFGG